mgnify:CR=1 FL=1
MKRAILPLATLILLIILLSGCELFIEKPEAGKVYAILVALDYKNTTEQSSLKGTLPDARELNRAWEAVTAKAQGEKEYHGYLFLQDNADTPKDLDIGDENVNSLPTSEHILKAIKTLQSITTSNDLIIFTYSGHGSEAGELLLVTTEAGKTHKGFPASSILDALSKVPGRKLMILDTCFSGLSVPESGASHSTLLNNNISKWYKKYWDSSRYTKPEVFVITASADTESHEDTFDGEDHGIFTYALLQGLGWEEKKGSVTTAIPPAAKEKQLTADSLLSYIKKHQQAPLKRTLLNPSATFQHPLVSGGALDMVLFTF